MPFLLFLSLAGVLGPDGDRKPPSVPPAIGAKVADFALKDTAGETRSLSLYKDKRAVVVVFIGAECPIANLYIPTLNEMQKLYRDKGVVFLGINSNEQDSASDVVAHAREYKVAFPVLKDSDQKVADAFGARRTPEAFLLDSSRAIRYHGRIDDQYGYLYRRAAPTHSELKDAIDELLAGKPVTIPQTEVRGCVIGRNKAPNNPTR
jgi:peroxiredoxin